MTELYFGVSDHFLVPEFRNRKAIDEIEMVMSAFDCVLQDQSAVYCSSDITSGRLYYDFLLRYDVRSEEELGQKLGPTKCQEVVDNVKRVNIARGLKFTETVRRRAEGRVLVNPGPFHAAGFKQEHYLYLWELLIIRKVCQTWFNEDWEYSNGCTLEYAIATKKEIPRIDDRGHPLSIPRALAKINRAVKELKSQNFLVDKLEKNRDLIAGFS